MSEPAPTAAPELAIVLPVYNEGEAVEPVLRALSAGVTTTHELVVVYDFDGDTTVPVVDGSRRDRRPARPSERPRARRPERDEGGHRRDIGAVRPHLDGGWLGRAHVVDPMVALARDGADVVAASRYMRGGRQIGGPLLKRC